MDYRALNNILINDSYPLLLIVEIFESLNRATIFILMDLKSAYHHMIIHPDHRIKTVFTWRNKQYVFNRAPFGLKNLPSKFQRVIIMIIGDLPFARAYLDDIIIFSKNKKDHIEHCSQVLQRLNQFNMHLNYEKCHFAQLSI